jgi:hypothetical protein
MLETMSDTDIHFYQPATGQNLPHDPFKAMRHRRAVRSF